MQKDTFGTWVYHHATFYVAWLLCSAAEKSVTGQTNVTNSKLQGGA